LASQELVEVLNNVVELCDTGARYLALVNKALIGKHLTAFTTVRLKEHSATALRVFEKEVIKFPEVKECYHLTGRFDFLLKMAIRDGDKAFKKDSLWVYLGQNGDTMRVERYKNDCFLP